jgi:hypothetical protein
MDDHKMILNNKMFDTDVPLKARERAVNIISATMSYFIDNKIQINEIVFVPLIIISRIIRNHDAILLLVENKFDSEAAVLVLTQLELRLDFSYTSIDIKHSAEWMQHKENKSSLQRMTGKKGKIRRLFANDHAEIIEDIFKSLSGVKHGNAVYGELGFPARWGVDNFSSQLARCRMICLKLLGT